MFEVAYAKLPNKPDNMTNSLNFTTLDDTNYERIDETIQSLKNESFRISLDHKSISKKNGGTYPLTIVSPRDKIVTEIMRLILKKFMSQLLINIATVFDQVKVVTQLYGLSVKNLVWQLGILKGYH